MNGEELPRAADAAEMPVDELAMHLLRHTIANNGKGSRGNIVNTDHWNKSAGGDFALASRARVGAMEAWDWLVINQLVVPDTDWSGWATVSDRGRMAASDVRGLPRIIAEKRLSTELHPVLERRVRRQFLLGEYELAVFAAMREVEIRVRDLGGYTADDVGVPLMRTAFHPETGPLRDPEQTGGERQATAELYAGAIGVFKNPSSHRQVDFGDPTAASEAVLFADLLHRLLDSVEGRLRGEPH